MFFEDTLPYPCIETLRAPSFDMMFLKYFLPVLLSPGLAYPDGQNALT
jgi:hypothetical protein